MTDFNNKIELTIDKMQPKYTKPFKNTRDTLISGRYVALYTTFLMKAERKTFGIMPTGRITHSHEHCVFIPEQNLGDAEYENLITYIEKMHDEYIDLDKNHEFTYISLVILTENISGDVTKKLKKYKFERQYEKPNTGYSGIRVAILDISNNKVYGNAMGSALKDRVKDHMKG